MSTERPTSHGSYGRVLTIIIAALVIAATLLGFVGSRQAPRVGAAHLDETYAVENSGAQLTLDPNQPIRAGRLSVTTTPRTSASVRRRDGKVVVTFGKRLHYDTTYEVSVGPVTGTFTGVRGRLTYEFRTPSPALFTLVRSGRVDDGKPDQIVALRPDGSVRRVVFQDDTILEYADAGASLLVSTMDDGANRLLRVGLDGHLQKSYRIHARARQPITGLRADPGTGLFGYITPADDQRPGHLYVRDVTDASIGHDPLKATDGTSMEVLQWQPVPGTREIVVRDTSSQVFMADPTKPTSPPTPLGGYSRLSGFLPNTTTLTLPDSSSDGTRLLDPLRGVSSVIPLNRFQSGPNTIQRLLLDDTGRALRLEADPGVRSGKGSYRVVIVVRGKARKAVATKPGTVAHVALCLAPDGGHVAAILQPTHSSDDRYPVQPAREGAETYLINTSNGSFHEAPGLQPQWCTSGPTSSLDEP